MLITGFHAGYWSSVYDSIVGCWLWVTGWCGGMTQHAAIVFVEIAVGTLPRAKIQRSHESCQFTTERIVNVIQLFYSPY